jgi:hypothetical protein
MAPRILNLDIGGRWMISFTPRPFDPPYPFDRSGGPQSRLVRGGEEKYLCPWQRSNPDRPGHSIVTVLTELSQYDNSYGD